MSDLTPATLALARAACGALSEPQRIAFAIELVRDITDYSCVFHLTRLERLAAHMSHELVREKFLSECG